MKPYAELLEFNQPSPVRKEGFTKIRDAYAGLEKMTGFGSTDEPYADPERIVEFAGRSDYGVKNAQKLGTDESIISRWIDSGHHSMLEFASATFYIECSRVVSHELVRHRLPSFQQESQRYVKYDDDASADLFFLPPELEDVKCWEESGEDWTDPNSGVTADEVMSEVYDYALMAYKELRANKVPAQIARYVLPNAMKTRLVMKANLREWRHIVNLRTSKAAQPEMQELMIQIEEQLLDIFPNIMYNVRSEGKIR